MDTDALRNLAAAADRYFDQAREGGLGPSGVGPVRGPVRDAFVALTEFHAVRQQIEADGDLSPEGKRARVAQLEATTREAVLGEVATARRRLDQARSFHEAKAQVPRRVDAAELLNARHDLDALTRDVPPGALTERLAFAARNGGPAVADLLLAERYPERVLLPTRGPEYAGDAAAWAQARRQLVADRLGHDGAAHLAALDAAHVAAKAVMIAEHAAAAALPEPSPGLTPIMVAHGAGTPPA